MKLGIRISALLAAIFLCNGVFADAGVVDPTLMPPIATLFKPAQYSSVQVSPNGKYLAVVSPINGRKNIAVIDLETRKANVVTAFGHVDVNRTSWIGNDRLQYGIWDQRAGNSEDQVYGGTFVIGRDGKGNRQLVMSGVNFIANEDPGRRFKSGHIIGRVPDSADEVFIESDDRSKENDDVYRVNVRTGERRLVTFQNPGRVSRYVVDHNGVIRVAISVDTKKAKPITTIYVRDNNDAEWRKLSSMDEEEGVSINPVGFENDNHTLFVTSTRKTPRLGLYTFDIETGQWGETLLEHPLADVGGGNSLNLIRDEKKKVVGFTFHAHEPETYWIDERYRDLASRVDATFKGRLNFIHGHPGKPTVVYSQSARDLGKYYLLNADASSAELIADSSPDLNQYQLSEMSAVVYKARDGLNIPAYLTLPVGLDAKQLPLVVLVHGGPYGVRDEFGFDNEVQLLASRGYAVLQPNYRGSSGYGFRFEVTGYRKWGLSMQDDLTDGVNWLVGKGLVDPKRVCIMGASYGGYAALEGLVKDPDLYKCGIASAAVSDILLKYSVTWSDYSNSDYVNSGRMMHMIGDLEKDKEQLIATSPARNAARFKSPVLIAHGAIDRRVPIIHAEKMRDALKAEGKYFEWLVIPDEGHGYFKPENQEKYYGAVLDFLARFNPSARNTPETLASQVKH
ncbi:S9 family peptidase [Burkholderiaceae bacterium DAT-1]|nr:S9 family peptidase [Burkholderiaceae bacterium DAT-1]